MSFPSGNASQSRPVFPEMQSPRSGLRLAEHHSTNFRSGPGWDWRWLQPPATREEILWSAANWTACDDGFGAMPEPVRSAAYHRSRQAISASPEGITDIGAGPPSPGPYPDYPLHGWQRNARPMHQYLSGHPIRRHVATSLEETMRRGREGYSSDRHREMMELQMWFGVRSNPQESTHTPCYALPNRRPTTREDWRFQK